MHYPYLLKEKEKAFSQLVVIKPAKSVIFFVLCFSLGVWETKYNKIIKARQIGRLRWDDC